MTGKALLKKTLSVIRDYPKQILLLPTLLGGFWQLMALSFISIEYVRFFSISQLVADGLLIIFFISVFLLFSVYILNLKDYVYKIFRIKKYEGTKKRIVEIAILSLIVNVILVILFVISEVIVWDSPLDWETILVFLFTIILMPFTLLMIYSFIGIIVWVLRKVRVKKISENGNDKLTSEQRFFTTNIFALTVMLLMPFLLFFMYHQLLYYPENFKNFDYVYCQLKKQYIDAEKDLEIVYFNDEYIFVDIRDREDEENFEVEVFKFDEFFKRENCK